MHPLQKTNIAGCFAFNAHVRLLVVNVLVQILHIDVASTTLSQTGVTLTPHDA